MKGTYVQRLQHTQVEYQDNQCMLNDDLRAVNYGIINGKKIRKLTPKETTRLMGFTDEDYFKMKEVNTDNEIYKQCGNSICVNVLEHIFKQML